jgi:AcrR family transcriptional regulator
MASGDQTASRAPLLEGTEVQETGRGQVAEIQRARMLGAALEAIDSHGYAGFTVAHVIQRAKVSRKTFYEVFVDREDCFATLFEQAIERVGSRVGKAYAAQPSWREGIRAGMAELLAFIDDEPACARLCVVDALAAGPRILARRAEVLERVRAVVELGSIQREGRREPTPGRDPLDGIDMRLTYRTVRALNAIADRPGASNREVARGAGISDQGQISKLLARLERLELIENVGYGQPRGAPNRWRLTERGEQVELSTRGP